MKNFVGEILIAILFLVLYVLFRVPAFLLIVGFTLGLAFVIAYERSTNG